MHKAEIPSTPTHPTEFDSPAAAGNYRWENSLLNIYADHYDRLVNGLARRFGDRHLAEDAVQDAFVAFHTKRCVTQPGREVAYLATSARNNALLTLRKETRRREIVESNAPTVSSPPSAEQEAMLACEAEKLSTDIGQLPVQQATVLVLRHVSGLSVAETADQLGVSTGTVKTHTHRAAKSLRTTMLISEAA